VPDGRLEVTFQGLCTLSRHDDFELSALGRKRTSKRAICSLLRPRITSTQRSSVRFRSKKLPQLTV